MRLFSLLLPLLFIFPPLDAQIAGGRDAAKSVYRQYDFDSERQSADAPHGYRPVYISHYGRHGSRYLYNNGEYGIIHDVFSAADSAGVLTETGLQVWDKIRSVYDDFYGRAGDLTDYGKFQHRLLAQRMYADYQDLFLTNPKIYAVSSLVPRCILSMTEFCKGLKMQNPALDIYDQVDGRAMSYMIPYSEHNPKFRGEDRSWDTEYKKYFASNFDRKSFDSRIFTSTEFAEGIGEYMKFVMSLYYFDAHLAGTQHPELSIGEVFTDEEYTFLYEMDNIKFYMRKGWGCGLQGKVNIALAESLMRDFITKAEQDLSSGRNAVRLRFGHDGAIMSLLAFLMAEGWDEKAGEMQEIKNVWKSSDIPMASNVRFVFYGNGSDIIVKFQHDERDVRLPLKPVNGVFYKWNDFKEYYNEKIRESIELLDSL